MLSTYVCIEKVLTKYGCELLTAERWALGKQTGIKLIRNIRKLSRDRKEQTLTEKTEIDDRYLS